MQRSVNVAPLRRRWGKRYPLRKGMCRGRHSTLPSQDDADIGAEEYGCDAVLLLLKNKSAASSSPHLPRRVSPKADKDQEPVAPSASESLRQRSLYGRYSRTD